jgi:hypothetical protein
MKMIRLLIDISSGKHKRMIIATADEYGSN